MARGRKGKSKGKGLTLLGLLAGAVVGGAIGLFYTPTTGEKNRQRLGEWAANRLQNVQQKTQGVVEGMRQA